MEKVIKTYAKISASTFHIPRETNRASCPVYGITLANCTVDMGVREALEHAMEMSDELRSIPKIINMRLIP